MGKNYEEVTVRSYKDDEMAGFTPDNRERGKWFIHGIKDGKADLIDITEEKEEAKEIAKETAHQEEGQTLIIIKDLESEIEKKISTDTTIIKPEGEE
jgi:hypothetical protein